MFANKSLMKVMIAVLLLTALTVATLASDKLTGHWLGTLEIQGTKLRLALEISLDAGALKGQMVSLDQGNTAFPTGEILLQGDQVSIAVPVVGGGFSGTLAADVQTMSGLWKQGGGEWPFTFVRQKEQAQLKRPQMPVKPYPYREEEVMYDNPASGFKLAGTLTLPSGKGPFPVVLLITGSGLQDRDESLLGHKPFLVLADALTRRGLAVLRVDDRGIGGSTGDPRTATTIDFASDVKAGVAYLRTRADIDAKRIGLLGHSEGGLIAPMVAAEDNALAFIVLMAGTGLIGEEIMVLQGDLIGRAAGMPEDELAVNRHLQQALFARVKTETEPEKLKAELQDVFGKYIQALPPPERLEAEKNSPYFEAQIQLLVSPWLKVFLSLDPALALARVQCPVLALCGEKDLQVPADANLAAIESALNKGGNTRFKTVKLMGLNHLFQTCDKGLPTEYGSIEETLSPIFLQTVGDWIEGQVRR